MNENCYIDIEWNIGKGIIKKNWIIFLYMGNNFIYIKIIYKLL